MTAFGSIQVSIPLSSIQEQQQLAAKNVELAKGIDQIKTQAMQDMARLRFYEAELAAAEIRTKFYHDQADWLKQRIEEGYSEMEKLWTVGGKLNDEKAAVERIGMLAATQQHKLAQYAGECWQELLAYLEEKAKLPAL